MSEAPEASEVIHVLAQLLALDWFYWCAHEYRLWVFFYYQIKKRCYINLNVFFSYIFVRLFAVEASCLINSSVWPAASCLSAHSQLLSHKIVPTSPMELIPINTLRRNSDVFESKRTIVCQRHLCHSAIVLFAQQWSNASFCANTVRWVTSSCLTFCLMWCY